MGNQGISSSQAIWTERGGICFSQHALIRVQQRGVDREILDCLLAYGRQEPDHKGCQIVTFDGKAFEKLAKFEPKKIAAKASAVKNLYAIVDSSGVLVTAGHRFRPVRRDQRPTGRRSARNDSLKSINSAPDPQH